MKGHLFFQWEIIKKVKIGWTKTQKLLGQKILNFCEDFDQPVV